MNRISSQTALKFTNEPLYCEIAARQWIEAQLNKSRSMLHTSLQSVPSGVVAFSSQGDILCFNQNFVETWQVPEAIVTSRNSQQLLEFCSNQLKEPKILTGYVQELPNQPDVEIYEILKLQDGRIFEQHSQPLRQGQQIIGRVWSFLDITERKHTQEQLLGSLAAQLKKHDALQQGYAPEFQQVLEQPSTNMPVFGANSTLIFPQIPQLRKVFDFIEANYHQPITLSSVAQAVGYSPAYLTDLVRRHTGQTVNRWIVERRMTAACSLLLETNRSVEQIATALGYQNTNYFFRQFRKYHGTTPCAWRKMHQAQCNTQQSLNNH